MTEAVRRQELQERQEKTTSFIPGCLYQHRWRPDGTSYFPYASVGLKQASSGSTPEDVVDDASIVTSLIHPDDVAGVVASFEESARTLKPRKCEYRVRTPAGVEKWVFGQSVPGARAGRVRPLARLPDRHHGTQARRSANLRPRVSRYSNRPAQPYGARPRACRLRWTRRGNPTLERAPLHRPRPVQGAERHQGPPSATGCCARLPCASGRSSGRTIWSPATAETNSSYCCAILPCGERLPRSRSAALSSACTR